MAKKLIIGLLLVLVVSGAAAIAILDNIGGRIIDEALDQALEEQPAKVEESKVAPGNTNPGTSEGQGQAAAQDQQDVQKQEEEKPQITKEEVKRVKESVTVVDKATITKMVLAKLTAADVEELKHLAAGGLTAAEKARAKEIAYSRFTAEEIRRIQDLYVKYIKSK